MKKLRHCGPKAAGLFCAAFILLAGCVHYHPQPLSAERNMAELEHRSLTNAELKTFLQKNLQRDFPEWPAAPWDFEMLTLAAFYYQPDLAVARAQWHAAQAAVTTAGGRPNPTLSLVPGYDTTHSSLSPWFPAVSFDLPIETAGKRGKRIAATEQLSLSARLNIATVAWQVRGQVRAALLDFTTAQRRTALMQHQLAARDQIVKMSEQQVQAGEMSRTETAPARIALQKLRVDFADAQRQAAEARMRLAQAVGVPGRALDAIRLPDRAPASIPDDLKSGDFRRAALLGRSDILAALADYAAAEASLRGEIAKQYPDVHLSPGYQWDQGDNKWSIGITFDLPILNHNRGPIAEAEAHREEAAAKFNAAQTRVLAELDRALEVLRVTEQNSADLQALAETQARQLKSVDAQYQAGAVSSLDLMNAGAEDVDAQLALIDADVKLQQAAGLLEDAVQRPLPGLAALESPLSSSKKP